MQTRNKFHTNSEDKYNVDWERWYDQMLDIKLRRERGQILTVAHSLDKVLESLSEFTRLKWENIHIYYNIQNAVADIMVLSFILTWTTWGSPPQSAIWRKEDRTTFNSFRHTKSTHACTHTKQGCKLIRGEKGDRELQFWWKTTRRKQIYKWFWLQFWEHSFKCM